jgi:Glycosyltransferase family 87
MEDGRTTQSPRAVRAAIRLAAILAIGFYAGTAHLTRGYEADFGKQWLAARLVISGHGRQLFDLTTQRDELERNYGQDVIDRGIWRDGIGGPSYPPPLAILLAPLGWLSPRWAAWAMVELSIVAVVVSSGLLQRLTRDRIHWEVATLAILTMPSFFLAMGVGQNSALSLLILVSGLALLASHNCIWAGVVLGLFVYKPTWGFAICWIPAVIGRPRVYLGMITTTLVLVTISLPICGIESWWNWLRVARQTEVFYQTIPRWTALSRDLPGLLRRVEPGSHIELAGWCIVLTVVAVTAWTWKRIARRDAIQFGNPATTALLAGVILSCPRFMFYDMTLAVVPFLLALADWQRTGRVDRWILGILAGVLWLGTAIEYTRSSMLGPPIDTVAVIGLWLWSIARSHDLQWLKEFHDTVGHPWTQKLRIPHG